MSDLQRLRPFLKMDADSHVRFVSERSYWGLECRACDVLLEWAAHGKWMECPRCGVEVTSAEAETMLGEVERRLIAISLDVRKRQGKGRWLAGQLLAHLFRLFVSSYRGSTGASASPSP